MGNCNYYVKARFRSAADAERAEPRLIELLAEGDRAYDYWQGSRPLFHHEDPNRLPPTAERFWARFLADYPLTYGYLDHLAGMSDWNNGLAGNLGCLVDPRGKGATLRREEDVLLLLLRHIWHGSDTTLLERYLCRELGAVAAASMTQQEEPIDEEAEEEPPRWTDEDFFNALKV